MESTTPTQPDWLRLPALVQTDLMMEVGLNSLEDLHTCRQVCRAWNEQIVKNVWGNASNRNKLENKLKECWRTGTPKYEKTEQIFDNKIEILAATGDCLVLINPNNRSSLRIFHRNEEEWGLTVEGYVRECFVTKEMLVLVTRNEELALKIEIYDLYSRAKIIERTPDAIPKIFCDGFHVLLTRDGKMVEIINSRDPSSLFKFSECDSYCRQLSSKYLQIVHFQYPFVLACDYTSGGAFSILEIHDTSKSISTVSNYEEDFSLDDANLIDAAFVDSNVVLLYDNPDAAMGSLTVHNANGKEIRGIGRYDDENGPNWCHDYGKFVISFGTKSRKTSKVLIYHEEDLVREDDADLVPREFEFAERTRNEEDEFDDEEDDDAVTVVNRTSIKRYRTNDKSLEIEMLRFWEE